MSGFVTFSGILGFILLSGFLMVHVIAFATKPNKKPRKVLLVARRKDLPSELTIKAGFWRKVHIFLTGYVNLQKTKLMTDKIAFSPPSYPDGSPFPAYRATYLTVQSSPAVAFARVAYVQLYVEKALVYMKEPGKKDFTYLDYSVELDPILSMFRRILYRNNKNVAKMKQISPEAAKQAYEVALKYDFSLINKSRKNFTGAICLVLASISLLFALILGSPALSIIPSVLVALVIIGFADNKAELWQWMVASKEVWCVDKDTAEALLSVAAYRNFLKGLPSDGKVASYAEPVLEEVHSALVWSSVFETQDLWARNFPTKIAEGETTL